MNPRPMELRPWVKESNPRRCAYAPFRSISRSSDFKSLRRGGEVSFDPFPNLFRVDPFVLMNEHIPETRPHVRSSLMPMVVCLKNGMDGGSRMQVEILTQRITFFSTSLFNRSCPFHIICGRLRHTGLFYFALTSPNDEG